MVLETSTYNGGTITFLRPICWRDLSVSVASYLGIPNRSRIEAGRSSTLTAVELDGAGGYEPGKVSRRVKRQLSAEEWRALSRSLKSLNFWKISTRLPHHGLDGAQWVLEGRSGREYHVVDRWSPTDGVYRDFCLMLVKFAGLMPSGERRGDAVY